MVPGRAPQEDKQQQSIVAQGTSHTIGTTENEYVRVSPDDLFEERAAIAEDGASVPRNWAESFARLDIAERPPDFTGKAWRQLIEDGGRFLDRWEPTDRKVIWLRASGERWKTVCWKVGLRRAAADEHWRYGLCAIAWRLNGLHLPKGHSKRRLIERTIAAATAW